MCRRLLGGPHGDDEAVYALRRGVERSNCDTLADDGTAMMVDYLARNSQCITPINAYSGWPRNDTMLQRLRFKPLKDRNAKYGLLE